MTFLLIVLVLLGIPLGLLALFVLLPIRAGVSGDLDESGFAARGWVRAYAGLIGVVFDFGEARRSFYVALGRRAIWRPKGTVREDGPTEPAPKAPEPEASEKIGDVRTERSGAEAPGPERSEEVEDTEVGRSDIEAPDGRAEEQPPQTPVTSPESEREPPRIEAEGAASEAKEKPSLLARWRKLRSVIARYWAYWQDARPILMRFWGRLWRCVHFRRLDLDVVLGTGDPAWTGRVFGYVEAVRPLLGPRTRLVVTPDFFEAHITGEGAVELSMSLARFLWALGCLGIRGGWVGWRIWRRERTARRVAVPSEA